MTTPPRRIRRLALAAACVFIPLFPATAVHAEETQSRRYSKYVIGGRFTTSKRLWALQQLASVDEVDRSTLRLLPLAFREEDALFRVRLLFTLEALAGAKFERSLSAEGERRLMAKKIDGLRRRGNDDAVQWAMDRAVAALDSELFRERQGEDVEPLKTHREILTKLQETAGQPVPREFFADVLPPAEAPRRRLKSILRYERFAPPPPLPEEVPAILQSVEGEERSAAFRTAPTPEKVEVLQFLEGDRCHEYPELLAAALLDEDWRVWATASRILWELDGDAEVANALGYALRHGLAREHVAELIDRIPPDAVYSVPLLRRAYEREDPRTIGACVRAARRTGLDGEAECAFFARADADDATGLTFARAFDQHGCKVGLAALLRLARSAPDPEVRAAALSAIGSAPRSEAVQQELLGMLAGEAPLVVEIATAEALLQLLPRDHPARPATARLAYLRHVQWASEVLTETISQQRRARKQTEQETLKGLADLLD